MRQPTASPALRAALHLGLGGCRNGSLLGTAAISRRRVLSLAPRAGHSSRSSSSSSSNPTAQNPSPSPSPRPQQPSPSPSELSRKAAIAKAVNPPDSTRPPPLDLPEPDPKASAIRRIFGLGKAYLVFYKNGLRAIKTNYHLRSAVGRGSGEEEGAADGATTTPQAAPAVPRRGSRAALQLAARMRHDLNRLPVFLLVFAVFVELTPLVAGLVPRIVPLTCRIPVQEDLLLRWAEDRRRASFDDLSALLLQPDTAAAATPAPGMTVTGSGNHQKTTTTTTTTTTTAESRKALDLADRHIARSLGLVAPAWDWVGWVPAALARAHVSNRLAFLALDDRLMLEAAAEAVGQQQQQHQQAVVDAAVDALVDDEVRIACAHRGIDVRGKSVNDELRPKLAHWLRLVADAGQSPIGTMRELLLSKPDSWPGTLPEDRTEKLVSAAYAS